MQREIKTITKQQFNDGITSGNIDIRPTNEAYINNKKYKVLPVLTTDENVMLEKCGCEDCGSLEAEVINEPFQEAVHDKIVKICLCEVCKKERVWGI